MGREEIAGARDRKRDGTGYGLLPGDGEIDDGEIGNHPEKVTPSGVSDGGLDGEEVIDIGESGDEKDSGKDEREGTEPRNGGARTKKKTDGEKKVAGDIEDENAADEAELIGAPTGGGVEEVKVDGDGNDSDLKEVEEADGVDAGRFLFGEGKKNHEDRSNPNKEKNVGRFGSEEGAGDISLIEGAEALCDSFDSESDCDEEPDLTDVAGRAKGDAETAEGGEGNDGEKQDVGGQQAGGGGMDKLDVRDEEDRDQEAEKKGKSREFARKSQSDLTRQKRANLPKSNDTGKVYTRRQVELGRSSVGRGARVCARGE